MKQICPGCKEEMIPMKQDNSTIVLFVCPVMQQYAEGMGYKEQQPADKEK
jgi:hypothetical protein